MDKKEIQEKLNSKLDDLNEKFSGKYQDFMDKMEINRAKASHFARKNPEKAMAISFGAGFVAGLAVFILLKKRQ